ncbi:zinc-binding dehydrogenase [Paenibacillus sp. CAU 1782]
MKAIAQLGPGKPEELILTELDKPAPGSGEIVVRIHAASLNPVDYKMMAAGHLSWTYPHVPGVDASGMVEEVGEGVTEWQKGDRVVFHGSVFAGGVCAEYAVTTAHTVSRIPDRVSFEAAAAFPCAGLTAYQALIRCMHIQPGQSLFVHGGAGGVGGYAIQLARVFGAGTIMTSCSSHNFDYVNKLGADFAFDYNSEDVHARMLEATGGEGPDLILNTVNRAVSQKDLSALSFGGQLACIAGAPETVADFQPSTKTFTLHKLMLGGAHNSGSTKAQRDLATMGNEFLGLMAKGLIDPMIEQIIALEEVPQALKRLSERHVRGKIVVKVLQ